MKKIDKFRLHLDKAAFFVIAGYILLSFRGEKLDARALFLMLGALLLLFIEFIVIKSFFMGISKALLICMNMLLAISLIMLYRLDIEYGTRQLIWISLGMIAMFITMHFLIKYKNLHKHHYIYMGIGLILLAMSLVFGSLIGGAKNWIKFESLGLSFQPSEFAKITLIAALASIFCHRQRRLLQFLAICYAMVSILMLVMSNDLGASLLYFFTFICIFYAATSSGILTITALSMFAGAAYASYYLFSHVKTRVDVWIDPFTDPNGNGYQLIQGLISMVSGGAFGSGLGVGSPRYVPAYDTDYIFTAISEEMGLIMSIFIILIYVIILYEGVKAAYHATNRFYSLLALGSTVLITIQTFIIIGGIIKLIPLTGITLPFVSYGGSSVVVSMVLMGIIQSVTYKNNNNEIFEDISLG